MERATGFEPATSSLGSLHSTPELRPHFPVLLPRTDRALQQVRSLLELPDTFPEVPVVRKRLVQGKEEFPCLLFLPASGEKNRHQVTDIPRFGRAYAFRRQHLLERFGCRLEFPLFGQRTL